MIRLEEKYEQAVQFRKRGFTYSEIAKIVGVSKSTVSVWLAKKPFSKKVRAENKERAARDNVKRIALVNKARAAERLKRYQEAERSAEVEFRHYKKDQLFIAGLMAYASNGDAASTGRIRLSSNDPFMHALFIRFACTYLGTERSKIRFWLLLYAGLSEKNCTAFWMKRIKLQRTQFYKAQFVSQRAKDRGLQHGTGNTIIGSTVLKMRLIRWIDLLQKELS